jgi:hypothetical protein
MINHYSQPPEKCGLERCRMRNRERALEVVSIVRTDAYMKHRDVNVVAWQLWSRTRRPQRSRKPKHHEGQHSSSGALLQSCKAQLSARSANWRPRVEH